MVRMLAHRAETDYEAWISGAKEAKRDGERGAANLINMYFFGGSVDHFSMNKFSMRGI
jgi:hypothetical protein